MQCYYGQGGENTQLSTKIKTHQKHKKEIISFSFSVEEKGKKLTHFWERPV